MEKRYQVFVSSTYADLRAERSRVMQTIMEMDCIPAGMELFPAADEEQFEFIKKIIDDCDYYILIIGGRYGSVGADGLSYTEKEYDYALAKGMKVLAFLHADPDAIALGRSEKDRGAREQLAAFRERVRLSRIVRFWKLAEELPGLVALALTKTMKTYPATGWIRGDAVASQDVLEQLKELTRANEEQRLQLSKHIKREKKFSKDAVDPSGHLSFAIHYQIERNGPWLSFAYHGPILTTMRTLAPLIAKHKHDGAAKSELTAALLECAGINCHNSTIERYEFERLAYYLVNHDLISIDYLTTQAGHKAKFWIISEGGTRLLAADQSDA